MTTYPPQDQDIDMASVSVASPPATDNPQAEPKYGGFTRFEIELEFVQCLANPYYLLHLATSTTATANLAIPSTTTSTSDSTPTSAVPQPPAPLLHHPPFIAYLNYLTYFSRPPYTKYLTYPGPTLKNLELLQSERFRREVLSPEVVTRLAEEGVKAVVR